MTLTTEQKVGLFFLVALVALAVMIELVEDWRPFETQIAYHTFFRSAIGIKTGDPVRLAGVEVGKIKSIGLEDGRVRIDFYVVEGTDMREDSLATIRQMNMLGGQFLGLGFGSPGSPPLAPGTEVPSQEGANVDELISSLNRNQERVFGALGDLIEENRESLAVAITRLDNVARKIDAGEGTLGRLVNDPALYDEVQGAVGGLQAVVTRLEQGEGSLGKLLVDQALYDQVVATVANLEEISAMLKNGQGSLGKLLTDDGFYQTSSDALAEIREIAGKTNRGEGSLGLFVNDPELYEETRATVARVNSIVAKIDEGQGTLGRLVNDDDLYRDVKTTLHKVEKAADGLGDSGAISALGTVIGTLF
jgi:phospholipid/cholesterol/gamma-HCH transport system substrate-binding protein